MPTLVHDVHQIWVKQELSDMQPTFLSKQEYDHLQVLVGISE